MKQCTIYNPPKYAETVEHWTRETDADGDEMGDVIEQLLNNTHYNRVEVEKIRGVKVVLFPAAGWSAEAPYTQTVLVEGITAGDVPIVSPYIPAGTTAEGEKAIKKAAGCVSYVDTGDGTITITCLGKKPVTDFQIQIKGV